MTTLNFNIEYKTKWGEELCIAGSAPQLGNNNEEDALVLKTSDGVNWSAQLYFQSTEEQLVEYYYFIRKGNKVVRREAAPKRAIILSDKYEWTIKDYWKEKIDDDYLYTSVFTECVFKQPLKSNKPPQYKNSIILNVTCPYVKKNEHVVIAGAGDTLGDWDLKRALPLSQISYGVWQIELSADEVASNTPYKFAIIDNHNLSNIHWEERDNRVLRYNSSVLDSHYQVHLEIGLQYNYASFKWKGKGVSIPVFSLRTEKSAGIGDFIDLQKMIDWAVITGQNLIQLLPINDTTSTATWKDSYPYSTISIFALNPVYIAINEYKLEDSKKMKKLQAEATKLNKLTSVDYEKVFALKHEFLKALFLEEGKKVLASKAYISFFNSNKDWLLPYVCFCYLRDKYNTPNFSEWEKYAVYNEALLRNNILSDKDAKKETDYYAFLQYIAYTQLSQTKEYAHQNGIALKGDIPIGINRNSVEAWTEPHLFNLDKQAGAPPDDFSATGQNWGFPTYNWERMRENNLDWWKRRFQKMADNFDAYRIDHILGFFRIWEMSSHHLEGILGHFNPALPLTKEELNQWGFSFDEQRMTLPYIHKSMLNDVFGEYTDEVIHTYLNALPNEFYQLKPFCDTQQKIDQLFNSKTDTKSNTLRKGLFALCAEVLFIPDPYTFNHFHPRIQAQHTFSFKHLSDDQKERYNSVYNDFFYKRHNNLWADEAMSKLPQLISATAMMVCGEDLGMVPECVDWVMNELHILSLEIERMPKKSDRLFSNLNELPYLSVNTTSTHDMSTIRGWWLEDRQVTQNYYNNILGKEGEAPEECTAEICELIITRHLTANSLWSILPWQDWVSIDENIRRNNPEDERINIPSNSEHYWRYRMHLTLERLLQETELNKRIKLLQR